MKKNIIYAVIIIFLLTLGGGAYFVNQVPEVSISEPEAISDLFEQGERYFNHSETGQIYDLEKARYYYTQIIEEDPKAHPLVWYQLGRIDFIEGQFSEALFKLEKQRDFFPDSGVNPDYLIGLVYGYRARSTGDASDWNDAAQAFASFIIAVPEAPWPRVDLAWVLFSQGKYEDMKSVLVDGLETNPSNAWLLNMYGLALLNTDDPQSAHVQFILAKTSVQDVTEADWGRAYPGNHPEEWGRGLSEFTDAIEKNITLAEAQITEE